MPSWAQGQTGTRGLAAVAVISLGGAVMAGCTSNGPETGSPGPTHASAAATDITPLQPFDVLRGEELGLVGFVQRQLRDRCLADAGYPQNAEAAAGLSPQDEADWLRVSLRSFGQRSEEEAQRLGFGEDSLASPARIISFDPSYDVNLERCADEAWYQLGGDAQNTHDAYYDLMNQFGPYRTEAEEDWPEDLPVRLHGCMVDDKGYQVDRDTFLESPTYATFGVTFGSSERGTEEDWAPEEEPGTVQVGPAVPPRRYTPTPEESALAVAWVQCLRETGQAAEQLAIALKVQQRYVDRFEGQIAELNAQLEPLARRASELLGEVG